MRSASSTTPPTSTDEAVDVLIGLVDRLAVSVGAPFGTLRDEAAHWAAGLEAQWEQAGRPFERDLVDHALTTLDELTTGPSRDAVLVHQDLHADNVLRAEREPWLVIDPKPIAGEREFAAAPVVRSYELGHGRDAVLRRLDRLVDGLRLDAERTRAWAFAQTLAWSFDGPTVLPRHVETARWLLTATR